MQWYYVDGGQRTGPFEESDFQAVCASGKVRPDTLIWTAGMAEWQPLSAVQPAFLCNETSDEAFCTECGRRFAPEDVISFGAARVCAGCKDVFFQRVREQGAAAAAPKRFQRYGGFWIRFLAKVLDGVILYVAFLPLSYALGLIINPLLQTRNPNPADLRTFAPLFAGFGIISLFSWTLAMLYEAWFLSRRGGTPGKLVCGLRVLRSNGDRLSFARGCGRYLATIVSSFTLMIGYIMAAFDGEKRALHDHICDTRVVYKSA